MRDLTGDFTKQHIKLRFQIDDVKGENAYTKFAGYSLSRDYMRSQIRRKTTRIEGVTNVTTKDGSKLRVKTIALAVGRAQTAQEKLVRKTMSNTVENAATKLPLDQFVQEVVLGKVSSDMYKAVNKIYPVKRVEIRKIKVLEL
jgi:small subunit ribosomal protein S3Ae